MLEITDVSQVSEIIDKGIEAMRQDGYKNYQLRFVRWDDEDSFWVVGFYTEEHNVDAVGVVVKKDQRGFYVSGRSYE